MEYRVKVIAASKKESVTLLRDGRYELRVDAPRSECRANERACALLAAHLAVPVDTVSIAKGHTQSTKLIRVKDDSRKGESV